ncbi:di-trans,poly-cis-decaprenylcistransferase, partial [Anncaliia algerae PRA339]
MKLKPSIFLMLLGIRISLFLIKLLKRIQNSSLIKRIRIPFIPLDLSKLKVAFIMDGNRRYAKSVNKTNPKELGLISMKETINFCHKLKIKELNFYVLSIKNLQRPESEISEINSLLSKKEYFNFKLKVIGN